MEGDERLRLFVALPLPGEAAERLAAWARRALGGAAETRLVPPGSLHFTLAFLGGRPAGDVGPIVEELRAVAAAAGRPVLVPRRYRETRSVGMVVFDDEGGQATALAEIVSERLARLGLYEPEPRPWLPHVTVLRFRRRPGLRPEAPDPGRVSPSEVALYHSVLRRTGAQYEIRQSVPLGG